MWLKKIKPVESLQSHFILTMSHWSSGLPVCFPSWGTRVQTPGGYLSETGILLLALSRYIGDPNVIQSLALSPLRCFTRLHAPTICKPTWSTWSHSSSVLVSRSLQVLLPASQPTESAARRSPVKSNLTSFSPCLTGPMDYPFASRHEGPGFKPKGGTYVKLGFSC